MCILLSNLCVGYRGRAILGDLDLSANASELVALIGRNGAGKSTLLRTIARLQPAIAGEITIAGKLISEYSRTQLAATLSIVSTESISMSHLTVKQLVSFGRFPYTNWVGTLGANDDAMIEEAMRLTGIMPLRNNNLVELSDGERQRVMIARTLAQDTAMILLDEPTAFLDLPNKYEILTMLHNFTRTKHKTIIFSTHDLNIAMQVADKLWLIIDDFMYEGAPEDLVLNNQFERIFKGSNLCFDDSNGQFNINRANMKKISVAGAGKVFFWTKKALERLGYTVMNAESEKNAEIIITEDDTSFVWTIKKGNERYIFKSIYELTKHIIL